jgi:hypothetical protein
MFKLQRNKNKNVVNFKSDDIYKFYKKNYSETNTIVSKAVFMNIIKEFNDEIFNYMIYSNMEFYMPARLGTMFLKSSEVTYELNEDGTINKSSLRVDYKKTLELWKKEYPELSLEEIKKIPDRKRVYHLNEHTDGKRVYVHWNRLTCEVRNKKAYRFLATRTNKRKIANAVKTISNLKYYG